MKTDTVTLVARGSSGGAAIGIDPTWTVSDTSVATLNTSVGNTVVLTPQKLGVVTVTALYDGVQANAQVNIVTYVASSTNYDIYTDNGLPVEPSLAVALFTSIASGSINEISSGYTPEGVKYQHSENLITGEFWGVTFDINHNPPTASKDLSAFSTLKFALRLGRTLTGGESIEISVRNNGGAPVTYTLQSGQDGFNPLSTDWQDISLSLASRFGALTKTTVTVPFSIKLISVSSPLTFDVDAIRWEQ